MLSTIGPDSCHRLDLDEQGTRIYGSWRQYSGSGKARLETRGVPVDGADADRKRQYGPKG